VNVSARPIADNGDEILRNLRVSATRPSCGARSSCGRRRGPLSPRGPRDPSAPAPAARCVWQHPALERLMAITEEDQ